MCTWSGEEDGGRAWTEDLDLLVKQEEEKRDSAGKRELDLQAL